MDDATRQAAVDLRTRAQALISARFHDDPHFAHLVADEPDPAGMARILTAFVALHTVLRRPDATDGAAVLMFLGRFAAASLSALVSSPSHDADCPEVLQATMSCDGGPDCTDHCPAAEILIMSALSPDSPQMILPTVCATMAPGYPSVASATLHIWSREVIRRIDEARYVGLWSLASAASSLVEMLGMTVDCDPADLLHVYWLSLLVNDGRQRV